MRQNYIGKANKKGHKYRLCPQCLHQLSGEWQYGGLNFVTLSLCLKRHCVPLQAKSVSNVPSNVISLIDDSDEEDTDIANDNKNQKQEHQNEQNRNGCDNKKRGIVLPSKNETSYA